MKQTWDEESSLGYRERFVVHKYVSSRWKKRSWCTIVQEVNGEGWNTADGTLLSRNPTSKLWKDSLTYWKNLPEHHGQCVLLLLFCTWVRYLAQWLTTPSPTKHVFHIWVLGFESKPLLQFQRPPKEGICHRIGGSNTWVSATPMGYPHWVPGSLFWAGSALLLAFLEQTSRPAVSISVSWVKWK